MHKDYFNVSSLRKEFMLYYYERLDESEKSLLPRIYIKYYNVNEHFIDSLSAKGKEVLSKICNSVSDIIHFLDNIKNELYQQLEKVLTSTKEKLKEKLKADDNFVEVVKQHITGDRNAFMKDVMTCKEVSVFYTSKFRDSILDSVFRSLRNLLVHNKHDIFDEIKEALNIKIVDNVVQHLHKIPPFAWLDMLHHTGAHGAGHLVHGLSYITKRLGGPEFKLPVIASILGLAFEYNVKGLIKHGLIEVVDIFNIPFVGLVIKTAGNVATFLACYELCRELVASPENFQHSDHVHKNHDKNHNQVTKKHILNRNRFLHKPSDRRAA